MNFLELTKRELVGKKLRHINQYNREVILEVEDIKMERGSHQITPDTPENDWWGESIDWVKYYVCFKDGSKITFSFTENTSFDIVS